MRTVLVTGATGRLGPHIVGALLAKDVRVRALTRDPVRAGVVLPGQADVVAGDLADPQALREALRGISDLVLLTPRAGHVRRAGASHRSRGGRRRARGEGVGHEFGDPGRRT